MAEPIGDETIWYCPSLDDAGNGTTTVNDLVGVNNGTLTNMTGTAWVADTDSGGIRCLSYPTINSVVLSSNNIGIVGNVPFSISMWVKIPASSTAGRSLIGFGNSSTTAAGLFYGLRSANAISLEFGAGRPAQTVDQLSRDTWHHVCVTKAAGPIAANTKIYYNASQVSSVTGSTATPSIDAGKFCLGAWVLVGDTTICRADDARVFPSVLTQAQITKLASMRGYQPPTGSAGFTGIRGTQRTLGT
jgi:hypothetical protein